MIITMMSVKGGSSKTHLALILWEYLNTKKRPVGIITNDVYTRLETKIPKNQLLQVGINDEIPIVDKDDCVIYDLGGYIDPRVYKVIKNSDLIIIPTIPDMIYLQSHLSTIQEVSEINKNIIQVVNRCKTGDFKWAVDNIKKAGIDYPIYEIKETKLVGNFFKYDTTIHKQLEERKFNNQTLDKLKQIEDFVKVVKDRLGL